MKQSTKKRGNIQNLTHFVKGQSGNPAGRPKGKSLKEYTRDMLASMTDDERQDFLAGLSKETIWKMAEGSPDQRSAISGPNNEPLFSEEHDKKRNEVIKRYMNDPRNAKGVKWLNKRAKAILEASRNGEL